MPKKIVTKRRQQIKQAQVKINKKNFENLCKMQCTQTEISAFFDVSVDTLERWCKNTYAKRFAEVFKEKREYGKMSLRRAQWRKAINGSETMQIWLGKQYLEQKDKSLEVALNTNHIVVLPPEV